MRLKPLFWPKLAIWLLCLAPLAGMLLGLFGLGGFSLGANPVEELLHRCGDWGLRLLLATLAVTPLRRWTGVNRLVALRRLLGLFAFFYLALHFTVYLVLDQGLDAGAIVEDIVKRPYITLGTLALTMLTALAATSTRGSMRRLGRKWQKLHWLIYPAAVLGVWHFYWQVKLDTLEPTLYAGILAVLLGSRWWHRRQRARGARHIGASGKGPGSISASG